MPELEFDEPKAIDIHAHPPTEEFLFKAGGKLLEDAARRFGATLNPIPYESMIEEYRQAGFQKVVLLGWDAETNTGYPPVANDSIAEARDAHPDFFIGFASVDPLKDDCITEAERAVEDLDLSGFKFQQIAQGFDPSDSAHEELFAAIDDLDVPVIFHGGNTVLGGGTPGGRGYKIKYGDPLLIDELASRHPDLPIILAHPAFPWEREQLAVCQHKGNVYMDLSGWSAAYIDDIVLEYAGSLLSDKVMFGTDYPLVRPDHLLEAFFEHTSYSEEIQRKILWENAERFFDLE